MNRIKNIYFDNDKIYFGGNEIFIRDIVVVDKEKISYLSNGKVNFVFYNNFFSENLEVLKSIHLNKKNEKNPRSAKSE